MKVNGINGYSNYIYGAKESVDSSTGVLKTKANGEIRQNGSVNNPDKLITSKEREFFINMFPENSESLEKHVLFNRNGRLQNHNLTKGLIVDGRA